MELQGKTAVVIGTKRSGLAAARLLAHYGARVRALDTGVPDEVERTHFAAIGAAIAQQTEENLFAGGTPDLVVPSPGVPWHVPLLETARARGITVMGEVELASFYLRGPVVGITGSNGKTTATALIGHMLTNCGMPCQVGGNIGVAVTAMVETSRNDQWNVLELSSFQLEAIERFRARIGVCLNVTPDHLDRHGTFENYAAAKARLFETQQTGDHAVLNHDDATCQAFAKRTKATVCWFSTAGSLERGFSLDGQELLADGVPFLSRGETRLRGLHNVENILAASAAARFAGAPLTGIADAIRTFPGVEHRIEFVRHLDGVDFYNDSKATNVDAALKAIAAFDGPLWVILGGKDKGSDYRPLAAALQGKAKGALLIGAPPPYPYAASPIIRDALAGAVPLHDCETLDAAIAFAAHAAASGDTVLLSPACASFDQYLNYEERGKRFKQIVGGLL